MTMPLDVDAFIAASPWRFAVTMPESPHEYVVRGQVPDDQFESFVLHIREHGYRGRFRGRTYTYLDVGEWTYWTAGAPVEETVIINRAQRGAPSGPV